MLKITTAPVAIPEALDPATMVTVLDAESSEQSRIQQLIQDATRLAEDIACRRLWFREYEQVIVGDGTERLYLETRPIASVVSIALPDDDTLTEGTDPEDFEIWAEDGFLWRESLWTEFGRWRCRYNGGYWLPSMGATPAAGALSIDHQGRHIRSAIEDIVRFTYNLDGQDPTIKSERIGGKAPISYTYQDGMACPHRAKKVLEGLAPIVT